MAAVIYHPAYREYSFGADHPFNPRRVDMTLDLVDSLGHPARPLEPPPATREEILDVHEEYYVRRVEELSLGRDVPDREEYGLDTPDTPAFPGMDRAARWHVGGTLHGARLICGGAARRVLQLGGGLHHARRNFASVSASTTTSRSPSGISRARGCGSCTWTSTSITETACSRSWTTIGAS
jgi:acetoin utilization protein AcuC